MDEKLSSIIYKNKMVARPGYYSGRGATLTDLNSEILIGIQADIKKEFGDKAAKSFLKMVQGIKVLSATTFLHELSSLCYSDWKYRKPKKEAAGIAIDKDENGDHNMVQGMIGFFGAMTSSGNDQTNAIRSKFLRHNGVRPKSINVSGPYGELYTY